MWTQLLNTLVITIIISFIGVYSYSACDDIDIHFIIDTDSIIQNSANVEKFIQSIVWNGTSEYSAVSIALYGEHIPSDMTTSIVIGLHETHSVYHRGEHERKILSKLRRTFAAITSSKSTQQTTITLSAAFAHSNDQHKPVRLSKKDSVFSGNDAEESTKMDEYFVFDHYNKLVLTDADNDEICSMMYHDRVVNKNVHFIMGQTYTKKSLRVQCQNGNVFYDKVDSRTFFALPDIMADKTNKQIETILDITCPTDINIDDEYEYGNGDFSLSNHVQWIDTEDITKCELVEIKNNDISAPFEIDSKLSFIEIKNYNDVNSDNTYQINDYLLIHKDEAKGLSKLGCWSLVYKIVDIKEDIIGSGAKLFVSLPQSPTEYIMRASVSGQHPLFSNRKPEARKLLTQYDTDFVRELIPNNATSGSVAYNYAGTTSATFSTGYLWDITVSGSGSINSTMDYIFYTDIDLNFTFDWNLLSDSLYLYYTLNSDYNFYIDFYLKFQAELEITIDDLIKFGKYYFAIIGLVPVLIKPFVDVDLKLTTLPIEVEANLTCNYGGYDQYGYLYDYANDYTANYAALKSNTKANVAIATETAANIQACADLMYAEDNLGVKCNYFDYNPTTQACRCIASAYPLGLTSTESGTTMYALDEACEDAYTIDCSRTSTCILNGDITLSSTSDGCGFLEYQFECIACTDDEGESDETLNENEIKIRTPGDENGCEYGYSVKSNGYDLTQCPRADANDLFGFDTEVTITIGANLYTIVIVYGKGILDIPFRINVPEFDDTVCSGVSSSCTSSEVMQASFDIAMSLEFYLGVKVDFSTITTILNQMIESQGGLPIDGNNFEEPQYETLIGEYTILEKTNLGCLSFDGALDFLDTYYKGLCCEVDDETGESVPVFIDLDDNGYDDRNEPTASPTDPVGGGGNGADPHGLSVFGIMIGLIGAMMNME